MKQGLGPIMMSHQYPESLSMAVILAGYELHHDLVEVLSMADGAHCPHYAPRLVQSANGQRDCGGARMGYPSAFHFLSTLGKDDG